MTIQDYIKEINAQYRTGNAREHAYRPMLQQLLGDMLPKFVVTNEPARVECGAPDFIISTRKDNLPVFFIEAKDIDDTDLDGRREHREQFNRYRQSLDHIIFTDYLDFHLYENGEWVKNVRLAEIHGDKICLNINAISDFESLVAHIADTRPQPITSASRLAQQMAAKARMLAETIKTAFEKAGEDNDAFYANRQLQSQLDAFHSVLIHDLTPEDFANIYAQTVAYGMFAARLHDDTPEDFSRQEAATLIPKSNPFLRKIFQQIAGYDLDPRIAWIVDDLVSIFLATDVGKVMKNYSHNERHNDPMIHFYEDFLTAFNPKERRAKGVFYTPQPVVQFIVRAVDEILQRDFNLPDGLADHSKIRHEVLNEQATKGNQMISKEMHRVQILDPATGTGTFLAEAVNYIYDKFRGMQGMWQSYVDEHLLPRLHGFEILMASYAIAHLKLDMLLSETGYKHLSDRRLKIYLTNSLEECHPETGTLFSTWLSDEANEANRIKRDCPVMVMMGNPPYSISSSNKSEWITSLIEDYKQNLNERNIQPLSDDYIKFIRLAQDYVERTGEGVMAYISNNSFIDGIIHREMRHQLLLAYDEIYIVNLHGNARKKEVAPDGGKDENVFDIMQGVSINIFIRKPNHQNGQLGKVHYKDLFGTREEKYSYLIENDFVNVDWIDVDYQKPEYFFVPKNFGLKDEYEEGVKIDELMPTNACGIVSGRDKLLVGFTKEEAKLTINNFEKMTEKEWRDKYDVIDNSDWTYQNAKNNIKNAFVVDILYRPFDIRNVIYSQNKGVLSRPRYDIMKHMISKNNLSICICRQQRVYDFQHITISKYITDKCTVSNLPSEAGYQFPLYLYPNSNSSEKVPNLNPEEWKKFDVAVGRGTSPEEVLAYVYAVLHSPSYRERYKEFLKVDFPRIPLPEDAESFERLVKIGQQLIDLHLMKDAGRWNLQTTFPEAGSQQVERYKYIDGCVWINETQYFGNVPESAWQFYIGGYQPAQKWLKDRVGRTLSFDEIRHYMQIVHALAETGRVMRG